MAKQDDTNGWLYKGEPVAMATLVEIHELHRVLHEKQQSIEVLEGMLSEARGRAADARSAALAYRAVLIDLGLELPSVANV